MKKCLLLAAALMGFSAANAQLNQNECKFLGNITTNSQIRSDFGKYWDQLTCENESKWGQIVNCVVSSAQEGVQKWNWAPVDKHKKWCEDNGVLFKFHAFFWTSQWPHCLANLTPAEIRQQCIYWLDAIKIKYPDLKVIDVVNETLPGHAEGSESDWRDGKSYDCKAFKNKLSQALGNSTNPYDYKWVAEAFKLAGERFPNAELVYNDYNTFTWQWEDYADMVASLVNQGAPITAYGHQSHDLQNDPSSQYNYESMAWLTNPTNIKNRLEAIHNRIKQKCGKELRCYITEYDIAGQTSEENKKKYYEAQIPVFWESDFVAGVTLWGYVNGSTWVKNSGIIESNGTELAAMKWLKEYMASDKAKNVTARFCGKHGAGPSGAISVSQNTFLLGDSTKVTTTLNGKVDGIEHILFLNKGEKIIDKWVSPYEFYWAPKAAGTYVIDATIYTSDGDKVQTSTEITVVEPNKPYGGVAATIPGTIEAENYDEGAAGFAYSDKSKGNECDKNVDFYRSDDVDIKPIEGGAALGSCQSGEWMSYTVNVLEDGEYTVSMRLGEGNDDGKLTVKIGDTEIPVVVSKIGEWGEFDVVTLDNVTLKAGEQTMVISIDQDWIDVDWIKFEKVGTSTEVFDAAGEVITLAPNPARSMVKVFGAPADAVVEFISVLGAVVKTSTESEISVADLPNGIYMVRIATASNVVVKRLEVNK